MNSIKSSNDKDLKRLKIVIILIVFGFLFATFIKDIFLINSKITCGKFVRIGQVNGVKYYHYKFKVNGLECHGSLSSDYLSELSIDSLKLKDCVKIQYSTYYCKFNRVVDSSILRTNE